MKIGIIGIRGIPVSYSTFETFAQALSVEFVKRGHKVSVYCRRKYVEKGGTYYGVDRIVLPSIETKHLSTFIHSMLSTLHAIFLRKYDLILFLGVGNTFFSWFPRFFGTKTVVHIDGIDWERKKWGSTARAYLKFSLFLTNFFPNTVISDNVFMVEYYKKKYQKEIENIPYGYFAQRILQSSSLLKKYGLKKKAYLVWVGRLVPENNLDELIQALNLLKINMKCLVIGDDLYESSYKTSIYKLMEKDKNIIRTGFIKHEEVLFLVANAFSYIETKRNGGTQMALIEAMGAGVFIISNDSREHKNILSNAAVYYKVSEGYKGLARVLQRIFMSKKQDFFILGNRARKRAVNNYQWRKVIVAYEKLFSQIIYFGKN